jgi:hypothetical protein
MQIYSVHVRRHALDPDRDIVLVKEGFSWLAMLFTIPWALWYRLWMFAAIVMMLMVATGMLGNWLNVAPWLVGVIHLAIAVICGLIASDARCARLEDQGFEPVDLVSGSSQEEAQIRFLDRNPAIAAIYSENL